MMEKPESPKYHGIVCFLDALGTRGVSGEAEVDLKFKKWHLVEGLLNLVTENQLSITSNRDIVTKAVSFSDTILITVGAKKEGLTAQAFEGFAKLLRMIIRHTFGFDNLLRGSFSIGEYYQKENQSIVFGEAVDDAAAFYECPLFAGIIATPRTTDLIRRGLGTESDMRFVEYNVPLQKLEKSETEPISTLVFNTAFAMPNPATTRHNLAMRREGYEQRLKNSDNAEKTSVLKKIVRKYKETERFLNNAPDHDPTVNRHMNDPST